VLRRWREILKIEVLQHLALLFEAAATVVLELVGIPSTIAQLHLDSERVVTDRSVVLQ
jgi:hypothetical protein